MTLFFILISAEADTLWKWGCADTSRGDYTQSAWLTVTASWLGDTHESCFSSGCVLVPNTMYLRSMRAPIYQHYSTIRHTFQHLIPNSPVCLQMSEIMHHTSCSMKQTHPRVSAVHLCMIRGVWWRACNRRTLYIYKPKKTSKLLQHLFNRHESTLIGIIVYLICFNVVQP